LIRAVILFSMPQEPTKSAFVPAVNQRPLNAPTRKKIVYGH
jgi:hypothetical protein